MRSLPLCGVRVLHPAQYDLLYNHPTVLVTAKKKKKKKVPWLSSSRSDWHVFSVVANQRQPQYIHNCFTAASVPTEANYYMYIFNGGGVLSLCMAVVV